MAIADRAVYPTQPQSLRQTIEGLLNADHTDTIEGEILSLIVPDSNLIEGGAISAAVYSHLRGRSYETVVVVSPSHSGAFRRMNICGVDVYKTPLGDVAVNDRMRNELCDEDDDIFVGDEGHYHTEGVDVQLPFLQTMLRGFNVVPIVMGEETPEFCRELGSAVGEIMFNRRTLLVASADIVRGESEQVDRLKELIEARDVNRLMGFLNSDQVEVEGKGAILVAMIAALSRRATHARVLGVKEPENDEPGSVGAVLWRAI